MGLPIGIRAPVFFTSRLVHATPDRGFRRTIFVVQCGVAQELIVSSHEFKRQAFSGRNHDTERFQLSADRVTEYSLIQRRNPYHVRNSMMFDERSKTAGSRWAFSDGMTNSPPCSNVQKMPVTNPSNANEKVSKNRETGSE